MDKPGIMKRGIIKKVKAQGKSPNNVLKKKLEAVQETIGRLRVEEFRITEKFLDKEDLRPKLRKSVLIRAVQNAGKHIISSTPHPSRKTDDQPFFGNNQSVMLSPISLESCSTHKKKELFIQLNDKDKTCEQNDGVQNVIRDSSQKELLTKDSNTPEKHNSSVVYVGTENYQKPYEKPLRKSKKDQSLNRSRIDLKKLTPDKNINTHKSPHAKRAEKSTGEIVTKLNGKSPARDPIPIIKLSKIPVRTASQEKERPVEANSSLNKLEKTPGKNTFSVKSPRSKKVEEKKVLSNIIGHAKKSKDQNINVENNLISPENESEIKYLEKTASEKKSIRVEQISRSASKDKNMQLRKNTSALQNLEEKCLTPRTRSTNRKEREECLNKSQMRLSESTKNPGEIYEKRSNVEDKTVCCSTDKDNTAPPKKNMADIVLQNFEDQSPSQRTRSKSSKERKPNLAESHMVSSKSPLNVLIQDETSFKQTDNVNANNKSIVKGSKNLQDDDDANFKDTSRPPEAPLQDQSVNNETDFVNKTPRRINNQTLELQNPVIDNNQPLILTEELDNGKYRDLVNKSRPSAVRERNVGLNVSTKSIGLSPIVGYLDPNKRKNETKILQNTKGEKSVDPSLADERSCVNLETSARSLKEASSVENSKVNPLEHIIAEISVKQKSAMRRTPLPFRRTVNVQVQTSLNNTERSYIEYQRQNYRRTRLTTSRVSRFAEQMTQTSLDKPATLNTDTSCTHISNSTSSLGAASDILTYIYEGPKRSFKYNIFESLEEGNELDALDFSDSCGPELSTEEKPWRFVNEGLITESSDGTNLSFIRTENQINNCQSYNRLTQSTRDSRDNSCSSSNDSGHSSYSPKNEPIKYSKSSSCKLFVDRPKLNNSIYDTTLSSKPKTRHYTRRGRKTTEAQVNKRSSIKAVNISKKNKNLVTRKKSENQKTMERENQLSENSPLERSTNRYESISSADKELLGVRRLSDVPVDKGFINNRSTQRITPRGTEELSDKKVLNEPPSFHVAISTESNDPSNNESVQKITPMVREKSVDKDFSDVRRLSDVAGSNEFSKHSSNLVKKKSHVDRVEKRNEEEKVQKRNKENKVPKNNEENQMLSTTNDILVPVAPLIENNTSQKLSSTIKTKRRTTRIKNDIPTDLGYIMASIDQSNIIQSIGRPQRNRKPVRFMTDIILEDIQVVKKMPNKKKSIAPKKSFVTPAKRSRRANSSIPEITEQNLPEMPNQNHTRKKRPRKADTKKKESKKKTVEDNVPINSEDNSDNGRNPEVHVRSNDEQVPEDFPAPDCFKQPAGPDHTENPVSIEAGSVTNTKTRGVKKTHKKSNTAHVAADTLSEDFQAPESFKQPECPDDTKRIHSENRVSIVDQSLTNIKTGGVTKTHKKPNVAQLVADTFSKVLERASESARSYEQSTAFPEQTNLQSFDSSRYSRSSLQSTIMDYFKYMKNGEPVFRMPLDTEYRLVGSLDVTQCIKCPNNRFSAGYIRLRPGQEKQPTIANKYYFVFNVMKGHGLLKCNDQTFTVKSGDSFSIMLGQKYSIQNMDSESDLVLSYTKMA